MDAFGEYAVSNEFAELHVDDARAGGGYFPVQFAGTFGAAADSVDDAGFPFATKYFHGYGDAAVEVFFCLPLVHAFLLKLVFLARLAESCHTEKLFGT